MLGNLKGLLFMVVGAAILWSLFGGGSSSSSIDLAKVLDRTQIALKGFQENLNDNQVAELNDETLGKLPGLLQHVMNMEPHLHTAPIGVAVDKASTFQAFEDTNMDNVQDAGEGDLFKVEIDAEGKRLIASIPGGRSTASGMATGLLTGMLLGRLIGNQRSAGIKPGHFAGRSVQSKASYSRSRSSARSSARSGGRFSGK